jgi:hypothetical protein
MFDVFTEQIEVLIKDGIANLYWYKGDLQKAWLRAGVPNALKDRISAEKDADGNTISKRKQMDRLYEELRGAHFNDRLAASRNFVRILIEHKNFVPQDPRHRIDIAERCALKLREILRDQETEREHKDRAKRQAASVPKKTYQQDLEVVRQAFERAHALSGPPKGYALNSSSRAFCHRRRATGWRNQARRPFLSCRAEMVRRSVGTKTHRLVLF